MDIVAYGAAIKASGQERKTRHEILGEGVQSSFSTMKERIDNIENSIESVNRLANKAIIQNAVNIAKANAKLNAVAKSKKYSMYNMVFDDFLDLSGIDTTASSGYEYDSVLGQIITTDNGIIQTSVENTDFTPKKAILVFDDQLETTFDYSSYDSIASISKIQSFINEHQSKPFKYLVSYLRKSGENTLTIYTSEAPIVFKFNNGTLKRTSNGKVWWLGSNGTTGSSGSVVDATVISDITDYEVTEFDNLDVEKGIIYSLVKGDFYISRDGGANWETINPEQLFYFNDNLSPQDNKLCLRFEFKRTTKLSSYALTWI